MKMRAIEGTKEKYEKFEEKKSSIFHFSKLYLIEKCYFKVYMKKFLKENQLMYHYGIVKILRRKLITVSKQIFHS